MIDITIIVTNYNYGKYLPRCLRSCLAQKNVNHEVVLVDDKSNEDIDQIIQPFFSDNRLVVIKNNENLGVAGSSNRGLAVAKGQFVIRVDADDYVNEDMCYFMRTYLVANKDAFCVSCDYHIVDNYENFIERKYAKNDPVSCGIMYRTSLLNELGGYNDNYRHREEEELRKRLGNHYNIHHLQIPFYRYRMHDYNKTKSKGYFETKV